ncbi:MAG: hypothetical protein ABJP48_05360 [Erythrobacter sp.]
MRIENPLRLVVIVLAATALAVLMAVQMASSLATRPAPHTAISLMPINGLATERAAFLDFRMGVGEATDPSALTASAGEVEQLALAAIQREPLLPKAHAILALAQANVQNRSAISEAAVLLNRRDASLQGVLLQDQIARSDIPAAVATVDRIMRVNPESSEQFYPILLSALKERDGSEPLVRLIEEGSPAMDGFLRFAVEQDDALPRLADLRENFVLVSEAFDRRLVNKLAGIGDFEAAERIYFAAAGRPAQSSALDWLVDYPPLDWRLSNAAGLRAQTVRNGPGVEINVRPGRSGLLMQRFIRTPVGPFEVRIGHSLAPAAQLEDVQLQLSCGLGRGPFLAGAFAEGTSSFSVEQVPLECDFMQLAIFARMATARSRLRGEIQSVELLPIE